MKKMFLKGYWFTISIILVWCIVCKSLFLCKFIKYTDDWLYFAEDILPDIVSSIVYFILLWKGIKKIDCNN